MLMVLCQLGGIAVGTEYGYEYNDAACKFYSGLDLIRRSTTAVANIGVFFADRRALKDMAAATEFMGECLNLYTTFVNTMTDEQPLQIQAVSSMGRYHWLSCAAVSEKSPSVGNVRQQTISITSFLDTSRYSRLSERLRQSIDSDASRVWGT